MDNKINITHIIINIKIFELSILINNKNLMDKSILITKNLYCIKKMGYANI